MRNRSIKYFDRNKKYFGLFGIIMCLLFVFSGCQTTSRTQLYILAAASLIDVCTELEQIYEAEHQQVDLIFLYGGSGTLQVQIEEGAPADLFISAAEKQMSELAQKDLIQTQTRVDLLKNKVVLIVPKEMDGIITSFEDLLKPQVKKIGLGEPGSVPVGQYSEEIFTSLGIFAQIKDKVIYGNDVRAVLTWVESQEVDCGVVYQTDAIFSDKVKIVCEAPKGSCKEVIYPAAVLKHSKHQQQAKDFLEFLKSDKGIETFQQYGFLSGNET